MNEVTVSGAELVLGGVAVCAVLAMVARARAALRRVRAAADIARLGTRTGSLAGRVLVVAAVIAGTQWLVITYAAGNVTLLWVVLGLPSLFAAHALAKALTVTEIRPDPRRPDGRR